MNERDDRLHQFFAGYFNQDWDIAGAASWSDVLDEYVSHNRRDTVVRTLDDLRSWLSESGTDEQLPPAFGCDYDPGPDGMDARTWVRAVADCIDKKVAV